MRGRMFDPECFSIKDLYIESKLRLLLKAPGLERGCLQEELDFTELVKRARKSNYLDVGYASRTIKMYETEDIGLGSVSSFSSTHLKRLMATKCLSPHLKVYLRFIYGNLFFLIDSKDIDLKYSLTKTITVAYNEKKKEIYDIVIGSMIPPNRLYHLERYDGYETTLEKALNNEMVSCFHVHSFSTDLSDLPQ